MKRNYITVVLLLASGVLLFTGCRKDLAVNPEDVTIKIPQEVKDYMQFKTGSWWLYEDSVSLAKDCVYVTSHTEGFDTVYEDGQVKQIYEYFSWQCHNTFEDFDHNYYVHQSWSDKDPQTKVFYNKYDNFNTTTIGIFLYPYILNIVYYSGLISPDTTYYQNEYSFLEVNSLQFYEVVQILLKIMITRITET